MLFSGSPSGLVPSQVRHAYNFDQVSFTKNGKPIAGNGAGETIAIVDAYDDPTITKDLKTFDAQFGLSNTDSHGNFVLRKKYPDGRPPADPGWSQEIALDVEWAHAIAPKAKILLVEAASASTNALLDAIDYARNVRGVVSVSMSWGGDESPFEVYYDDVLSTPAGHRDGSGRQGGVTFVTSSGDSGAQANWPAVSPHALAVGGTTLHTDSQGNYLGESAWAGSGGGLSVYEPDSTKSPDVAYNADPDTGFSIYSSTPDDQGDTGWATVGGTSAGAPQWAALLAIAAQGRNIEHKGALYGISETIPAIYQLPQSDFHDITTGSNGYRARTGFDLVTGRGTPFADRIITDLVNV